MVKYENTMKNDLKPCPFCGSPADLEDHRLCWFVRCSSCGAGVMGDRAPEPEHDFPDSYWESFRQSAVERWNHRTTPAPVSVSKRLPEATDCDDKGRCWVGYGEATDEYDSKDQELNPSWELCKVHPQDEFWLPAQSLPIPPQT